MSRRKRKILDFISASVLILISSVFFNSVILVPNVLATSGAVAVGCAAGGSYATTTSGFIASDLTLSNVQIGGSGSSINLDTGRTKVDVHNIVVPFDQSMNISFIYEGASYTGALGWFLVELAEKCMKLVKGSNYQLPTESNPNDGIGFFDFYDAHNACLSDPSIRMPLINWIFPSIQDDDHDGVFDYQVMPDGYIYDISMTQGSYGRSLGFTTVATTEATTEDQYSAIGMHVNGDGRVDIRDSTVKLPIFKAGTEIAFIYAFDSRDQFTYFSKKGWDKPAASTFYAGIDKECPEENEPNFICSMSMLASNSASGCLRPNKSGKVSMLFNLSWDPLEDIDWTNRCSRLEWSFNNADADIDPPSDDYIPLFTHGIITSQARSSLSTHYNLQFSGLTEKRILQYGEVFNHYEGLVTPADKFRWIVALENQQNGGDVDFNDVIFLIERLTGGTATLSRALSPADSNAYITTVKFTVDDHMPCDGKTMIDYQISPNNGLEWIDITASDWDSIKDGSGNLISNWSYGRPARTIREVTINMLEQAVVGNKLIWKTIMTSRDDACIPRVEDVSIEFKATTNRSFSRSSATILGNVSYTSSFETPALSWKDHNLRGHLIATELYDPIKARDGVGFTPREIWDSGVAMNNKGPSARKIYTPALSAFSKTEPIGKGDGSTKKFSLKTTKTPLVYGSIEVSDGSETFIQSGVDNLQGSLGGSGTINRYGGDLEIQFNSPPASGATITAKYFYYFSKKNMIPIENGEVDRDALGLDKTELVSIAGRRFLYDYDKDNKITESDSKWLKDWVRGYNDGYSRANKKDWMLAAIDHSTPALVGAPAIHSWYYGTDVENDIRSSFDRFMCEQRARDTKVYLGSRMGMIHSFDAGEFRGFYLDESKMPTSGDKCADPNIFKNLLNNKVKSDPVTGKSFPIYVTPTGKEIFINRGYYEWTTSQGPDYGKGEEDWAIIPNDQLPKLKNHASKRDDKAFVDASPSVAYLQFADKSWRTVLITAEGNGGDAVIGVDITNPYDPKFLWEFGSPELFRSRSSPSIGSLGRIQSSTGPKWVVFFVSGINNNADRDPSIFMIDVETGTLITKIILDSAGRLGKGGTLSGQPAVIDSDSNGYVDKMFIGSDKGFMYKVLLPDKPSDAGNVIVYREPFYNARQPIYASPAVVMRERTLPDGAVDITPIVLFGTSDSPYQEDKPSGPSERYKFLSVGDNPAKDNCGTGAKLWEKELDAGHRVFASAFASANNVYFGTSTKDTEDPCGPNQSNVSSSGSIYIVDIIKGPSGSSQEIKNAGDTVSSMVVEDEHLYVRGSDGTLKGYGSKNFQNEISPQGSKDILRVNWREINR